MVANWTVTRFRSAWLSQNMDLLVLKILSDSSLSEWEILSRLHSKYGLNPSAREFARLERAMVGKGFVRLDTSQGGKFEITELGVMLLRRLEEEYRSVVREAERLRLQPV